MDDTRYTQELARIINEYHRRGETPSIWQRYRQVHPDIRLNEKGIQRALHKTFAQHGMVSLTGKRILDVGCGSGGWLQHLTETYEAEQERCTGIDLLEERITAARATLPQVEWHVGSAHRLPLASTAYDLILAFTVFSSILDDALCAAIALKMWRVLAPGGFILWYDYTYNNPSNHAVRGMPLARVRAFFPEGIIGDVQRITLAPPLARRIAPRAYWLAAALERSKALNTHLLMTIQKSADAPGKQSQGVKRPSLPPRHIRSAVPGPHKWGFVRQTGAPCNILSGSGVISGREELHWSLLFIIPRRKVMKSRRGMPLSTRASMHRSAQPAATASPSRLVFPGSRPGCQLSPLARPRSIAGPSETEGRAPPLRPRAT